MPKKIVYHDLDGNPSDMPVDPVSGKKLVGKLENERRKSSGGKKK